MEATKLWHEHKLLRDKCVLAIARLMRYNDEVTLRHPINLLQEPDVQVTGIKFKNGEMLVITTSFGFLKNRCFPAKDCFITLRDYISILDQIEKQFNNNL